MKEYGQLILGLVIVVAVGTGFCFTVDHVLDRPQTEVKVVEVVAATPIPPRLPISSVVQIVTPDGGSGSGVVVRNDLDGCFILTAAHVTFGSREVRVVPGDPEEAYVGTVLVEFEKRDVAVLRVLDLHLPTVPIASVPLRSGDQVWCIGYPYGEGPFATSGYASGIRPDEEIGDHVRVSADSQPGNSGGPILVLEDGRYKVVGLLVRGWGTTSFMCLAVPLDSVQSVLRFLNL